MAKFKIQNKFQFQTSNHKTRFCHLCFVLCHCFVICALSFVITNYAYALDLDGIRVEFLKGDYKAAILSGEKALAQAQNKEKGLDQVYYILGLAYLKDGNYLRASDIFEIILNEYEDTNLMLEATLGLGDAYFLLQDFAKAEGLYKEVLKSGPEVKFKGIAYQRLADLYFKKDQPEEARKYLARLKDECPLAQGELCELSLPAADVFYSVQVGSFSKEINAKNLVRKLDAQGYPAHIDEPSRKASQKIYRVRVGKLSLRKEAEDLAKKLSLEGYPAKIFP